MRKNPVSCTPYLRNHTSYDFHLWYTCKMIDNKKIYQKLIHDVEKKTNKDNKYLVKY